MLIKREVLNFCLMIGLLDTLTNYANARFLPQTIEYEKKEQNKFSRSKRNSPSLGANGPELYTLPRPIKSIFNTPVKPQAQPIHTPTPTTLPPPSTTAAKAKLPFINEVEYDLRLRQLMEELVLGSQTHETMTPQINLQPQQSLLQATQTKAKIKINSSNNNQQKPSTSTANKSKPNQQNNNSSSSSASSASSSPSPSLTNPVLDYVLLEFITKNQHNLTQFSFDNSNSISNSTKSSLNDVQTIQQQLEFLQKNSEKFKKFQQVQERGKNSTTPAWPDSLWQMEEFQRNSLNATTNNLLLMALITNVTESPQTNYEVNSKISNLNSTESSTLSNESVTKINNITQNNNYSAPISLAEFIKKLNANDTEQMSSNVFEKDLALRDGNSSMNAKKSQKLRQNQTELGLNNLSYTKENIERFDKPQIQEALFDGHTSISPKENQTKLGLIDLSYSKPNTEPFGKPHIEEALFDGNSNINTNKTQILRQNQTQLDLIDNLLTYKPINHASITSETTLNPKAALTTITSQATLDWEFLDNEPLATTKQSNLNFKVTAMRKNNSRTDQTVSKDSQVNVDQEYLLANKNESLNQTHLQDSSGLSSVLEILQTNTYLNNSKDHEVLSNSTLENPIDQTTTLPSKTKPLQETVEFSDFNTNLFMDVITPVQVVTKVFLDATTSQPSNPIEEFDQTEISLTTEYPPKENSTENVYTTASALNLNESSVKPFSKSAEEFDIESTTTETIELFDKLAGSYTESFLDITTSQSSIPIEQLETSTIDEFEENEIILTTEYPPKENVSNLNISFIKSSTKSANLLEAIAAEEVDNESSTNLNESQATTLPSELQSAQVTEGFRDVYANSLMDDVTSQPLTSIEKLQSATQKDFEQTELPFTTEYPRKEDLYETTADIESNNSLNKSFIEPSRLTDTSGAKKTTADPNAYQSTAFASEAESVQENGLFEGNDFPIEKTVELQSNMTLEFDLKETKQTTESLWMDPATTASTTDLFDTTEWQKENAVETQSVMPYTTTEFWSRDTTEIIGNSFEKFTKVAAQSPSDGNPKLNSTQTRESFDKEDILPYHEASNANITSYHLADGNVDSENTNASERFNKSSNTPGKIFPEVDNTLPLTTSEHAPANLEDIYSTLPTSKENTSPMDTLSLTAANMHPSDNEVLSINNNEGEITADAGNVEENVPHTNKTEEITTDANIKNEISTGPSISEEIISIATITDENTRNSPNAAKIIADDSITENSFNDVSITGEFTTNVSITQEITPASTIASESSPHTTGAFITEESTTHSTITGKITSGYTITEEITSPNAITDKNTRDSNITEKIKTDGVSTEEISPGNTSTEKISTVSATTEEITADTTVAVENTSDLTIPTAITADDSVTEENATDSIIIEEIATTATIRDETTRYSTIKEKIKTHGASTKEIFPGNTSTEEVSTVAATTEEITPDTTVAVDTTDHSITEENASDSIIIEEITTHPTITEENTLTSAITDENTRDSTITEESTLDSTNTGEITSTTSITDENSRNSFITEEITTDVASTEDISPDDTITEETTTVAATTEEINPDAIIAVENTSDSSIPAEITADESITEETATDLIITEEITTDYTITEETATTAAIRDENTGDSTITANDYTEVITKDVSIKEKFTNNASITDEIASDFVIAEEISTSLSDTAETITDIGITGGEDSDNAITAENTTDGTIEAIPPDNTVTDEIPTGLSVTTEANTNVSITEENREDAITEETITGDTTSNNTVTEEIPTGLSITVKTTTDVAVTEGNNSDNAITAENTTDGTSSEEISPDNNITEEIPTGLSVTAKTSTDISVTEENSEDAITEGTTTGDTSTEAISSDNTVTKEIPTGLSITVKTTIDVTITEGNNSDEAITEEITTDVASTEEISLDHTNTAETTTVASITKDNRDDAITVKITNDSISTENISSGVTITEITTDASVTEEDSSKDTITEANPIYRASTKDIEDDNLSTELLRDYNYSPASNPSIATQDNSVEVASTTERFESIEEDTTTTETDRLDTAGSTPSSLNLRIATNSVKEINKTSNSIPLSNAIATAGDKGYQIENDNHFSNPGEDKLFSFKTGISITKEYENKNEKIKDNVLLKLTKMEDYSSKSSHGNTFVRLEPVVEKPNLKHTDNIKEAPDAVLSYEKSSNKLTALKESRPSLQDESYETESIKQSETNDDIRTVTEIVWLTQSSSIKKPAIIIENVPYAANINRPLSKLSKDPGKPANPLNILKSADNADNLSELIAIIGNSLHKSQAILDNVNTNVNVKSQNKMENNNQDGLLNDKNYKLKMIGEEVTATVNCHTTTMAFTVTGADISTITGEEIQTQDDDESITAANDNSAVGENIQKWPAFINNQLNNDSLTKSGNVIMSLNANTGNTNDKQAAVAATSAAGDEVHDDDDEGNAATRKTNNESVTDELNVNEENKENTKSGNNVGTDAGSTIQEHEDWQATQIQGGINEMSTIENKWSDISKHKSNSITESSSSTTSAGEIKATTTTTASIASPILYKKLEKLNKNAKTNEGNSNSNEDPDDQIHKDTEGLNSDRNNQSFPDMTLHHHSQQHQQHLMANLYPKPTLDKTLVSSDQTKEEITATNWWHSLPYTEIRKFLNSIFDSVATTIPAAATTDDFILNETLNGGNTATAISKAPGSITNNASNNSNKVKTIKGRKSKREQWPTWILNNIWSTLL